MKILFFVHRYWPCVGGVEKYIHQLGRALLARGHEVDVVTGAYMEDLPEHEIYEGINVHRFPAMLFPPPPVG